MDRGERMLPHSGWLQKIVFHAPFIYTYTYAVVCYRERVDIFSLTQTHLDILSGF